MRPSMIFGKFMTFFESSQINLLIMSTHLQPSLRVKIGFEVGRNRYISLMIVNFNKWQLSNYQNFQKNSKISNYSQEGFYYCEITQIVTSYDAMRKSLAHVWGFLILARDECAWSTCRWTSINGKKRHFSFHWISNNRSNWNAKF